MKCCKTSCDEFMWYNKQDPFQFLWNIYTEPAEPNRFVYTIFHYGCFSSKFEVIDRYERIMKAHDLI
jgi:hypothetical protein